MSATDPRIRIDAAIVQLLDDLLKYAQTHGNDALTDTDVDLILALGQSDVVQGRLSGN